MKVIKPGITKKLLLPRNILLLNTEICINLGCENSILLNLNLKLCKGIVTEMYNKN